MRLRPVPPIDPPYADEVDGTYWSTPAHGQLALDLFASTRPDPIRPPERRAALRRVPTRPGTHPGAPKRPVTTPEPTRAAHRFVGTCLEVTNGYRSPAQLRPLLDPAQAGELLTELARATERAAGAGTPGRTGPTGGAGRANAALVAGRPGAAGAVDNAGRARAAGVAGRSGAAGAGRPGAAGVAQRAGAPEASGVPRRRAARPVVRLRLLRVCEPREAAVEVAAVFTGAGGCSWAMALRLEHRRGRWLCTALQVL
ncbi:Rv3235 family protein [Micromonospora sp. CPCC 205539]|uniref:Rv3235 family protein n=1 Tax=Micromonospora sp. CPCC 205539 TaxID=3122408 RepID=UPI002FF17A07